MRQTPPQGFTLIEVIIALSIVAILATMAAPSFYARTIRAQVKEGMQFADFAKQGVANYYAKMNVLPSDNATANLPPADRIVSTHVSAIAVNNGVLSITFGKQASPAIAGKTLTLLPATVPGYPQVPISWVCGAAPVPAQMTTNGRNATDIPTAYLPYECMSKGTAK